MTAPAATPLQTGLAGRPRRPGARVTLTDRRGFERGFSPDPGWAYRPGKSPLVNTPLTPAEKKLVAAAARGRGGVAVALGGGGRLKPYFS